MTAYPVLSPSERSCGNVMQVLPYVISIYRMKQTAHTACIPSTPFFNRHLHYHHHHCHYHHHHHHCHHHHNYQHRVFHPSIILPPTGCNTPLPAKHDPPLPACSLQSQIHCSQRSQIHRYQLAPSEARLSEWWEWAFHRYQLAPSEARSIASSEARLS